jgi:exodeoxyribonuclease VII large subunit
MQGAECPKSVIAALDSVLEGEGGYDVVLILRGGGSKLDLACFDDYEMAAVIAQFPLPVLTAIGHDQDHHVCDMVAHSYLKTPTALADEMLSIYEDEDARISALQTRIRIASTGRISVAESALEVLRTRIRSGFSMKITSMEAALQVLRSRIVSADPRRILERGYALALDADGRVMKSVSGRSAGDKVSMMFADGRLDCRVEDVKTN